LDHHPVATDVATATSLSLLVLLNLWIDLGTNSPLRLSAAIVLILLTTLPLAARRRSPLAVLLVITAALIAFRHLSFPESPFTEYCLLLAFVSAGVYGSQRRRTHARLVSAVTTLISLIYIVFFAEHIWILPVQAVLYKISIILFELFLFIAAWWVGEVFRIRREHELELEVKNEMLAREAEGKARHAVVDERIRIARELHDVVAHHVSVMGIQAGAARRIMSLQPERVSGLLLKVEDSSRQAISELQRLLGFLRGEEKADQIAPQPVLTELDTLIQQMKDTGLEAELSIQGDLASVPPTINLSAYRIIQEALTNTLKHAYQAKAIITLQCMAECLIVEVLDNGPGYSSKGSGKSGGRGLVGMRERVMLFGGEFIAGNAPGGGFLVRAVLPYGRQVT
jgi:signal transduction histidine kinase